MKSVCDTLSAAMSTASSPNVGRQNFDSHFFTRRQKRTCLFLDAVNVKGRAPGRQTALIIMCVQDNGHSRMLTEKRPLRFQMQHARHRLQLNLRLLIVTLLGKMLTVSVNDGVGPTNYWKLASKPKHKAKK